jgi:phytoene dehydrogenase-like protein
VPHDAVVVGSGPNGLAAAVTLAEAGLSVLVREGAGTIGGGTRSAELTLPGFVHDICSAVHPLAAASPFFRRLPLAEHGLELVQPPLAVAHPLEGAPAAAVGRDPGAVAGLGEDTRAYARLFGRLRDDWSRLEDALLGPLPRLPRHPLALARFGVRAGLPSTVFARRAFDGEAARALFGGAAAHSVLPLGQPGTAAFGLVLLSLAHVGGWPIARGGSLAIADALASYLRSLGGEIEVSAPVKSLAELAGARLVLLDVGPRGLDAIAGTALPARYRRRLQAFRYGPGVFKVDYALSEPIPWADPACAGAGTVHLGGRLEELAASEREPWRGRHAERPFVLLSQPTLFDPSRAPAGKHVAWAYCHVPNGSQVDMTAAVDRQIERFAPGFGDVVLARSARGPRELEHDNPNLVGGDVNGGANTLLQLVRRPTVARTPYRTPLRGVYLCSASTPPGGGVHGMCGYLAASAALADLRSRD